MKNGQIEKLRIKLGMDRHQFGQFLCLGYKGLMNIENGVRNPNPFAAKVLLYLESLPKTKALAVIEELNRHEPK